MKSWLFVCCSAFLFVVLTSGACRPAREKKEATYAQQDSLLYGSWTRSYEDDKGMDQVWRPSSYKFPPSRGRDGFALMREGKMIFFGPGPNDAPLDRPGTWGYSGPKVLRMSLENGQQMTLRIKEISKEKLIGTME